MARDKKIAMTVHFPPDLIAELKSEQLGDSFSVVIVDRLRQALKMGPRQQSEASPLEAIDLRKKEAEAAMAERREKIMAGQYVRVERALAMVAVDFGIIRSRVKAIPSQINGLTPEQFADAERAVQDAFTDLSAEDQSTWDDLAEEAAKESP